jgi:ribonucleoside-diphosphate reductase alpha chain
VVNKHLLRSVERGLWNETLKQEMQQRIVQDLNIPQDFERIVQNSLGNVYERYRYVTSWVFCRSVTIIELVRKMLTIQTVNAFWQQSGLKTGMYYLRTKAAISLH